MSKQSDGQSDPISFLQARPTIFLLNFPNIRHIAYIYNRIIAHLAGMKMNHGKSVLHLLFKCIDYAFFSTAPVSIQVYVYVKVYVMYVCNDKIKSRIV